VETVSVALHTIILYWLWLKFICSLRRPRVFCFFVVSEASCDHQIAGARVYLCVWHRSICLIFSLSSRTSPRDHGRQKCIQRLWQQQVFYDRIVEYTANVRRRPLIIRTHLLPSILSFFRPKTSYRSEFKGFRRPI